MKNLLLPVFTLFGMIAGDLLAQTSSESKNEMGDKEKMQVFRAWSGRWEGEGSMQMGPGEPKKSSVMENIELKLDGMIVVIEGIGKSIDPATKQEFVTHHAFAILSYDKLTDQYKFRTHLKDGQSTEAWFTVVSENKYTWGFETNRGKIRYHVTLDPAKKTWNETGEYSADGTTWRKFFEMNLKKVG